MTSLESLAGKTAAAQTGTIQAGMLQTLKQLQGRRRQARPDRPAVPQGQRRAAGRQERQGGLRPRQLPTAVSDVQTARRNAFEIAKDPAAPNGYNPSTLGIGMVKANSQLLDAVAKALQSLVADGTYTKILDKYGLGAAAVTTVEINLGAGA